MKDHGAALSEQMYKKLEKTLWDITHRAQKIRDLEIENLADKAVLLLQNYSGAKFMESEKAQRV
jgi:hypothetical protein